MADAQYLQENVGDALTAALTSTAAAQPDDPVEYMAHWLLKYLAVEEKKAKVKEAEAQMIAEKEAAEKAETAKTDEQTQVVYKIQKIKDDIAACNTVEKLYSTVVEGLIETTSASNTYIALLEKKTPPEGEEEPPEPTPEPPAEPAEGEEAPPPAKLAPVIPKFAALKYVFANDQNDYVKGVELPSPALGKKPSVSWNAVESKQGVLVRNVMESDPPLVFHDMPLPGSFACHPLLSSETDTHVAGGVMGMICCDTLMSDTVLMERDQEILREVAAAASATYERLVTEAADRVKGEETLTSELLEEATTCPEDQKPADDDDVDKLEGKIEAAVATRVGKCKTALREQLPMAKASEHGHEMAEISAYAEGSDGDRVVKALAALVGGTAGDLAELFELVQGFDVKVVQEAAVTASKAVLNPEGAEELTKASGGFDFGAKLLFALLSVLLELSAPAMKLVGMKQAAEEARQAAEAERIAAEEKAAAEAAEAAPAAEGG
eukprot:CAMPEP_0177713232 /NCGR_PEP_ID=MMETSP0484_2-20121128/12827_1 /TAXON_ID=354590 /ORGANISM="Rhodomonas lens, Strain RHODO" /LENGTH=493 /DNA_ID=CAMNT_0019225103 /DNA_START=8 /DNA_END=1485 /DNA_ORIENTATION=+